MDKVFIKGLEVEGIIGIFQWEREVRQIISVDIEMDFDNKNAAKSDSIEDALNYKLVGKRITSFIKDSKFQLVETLAENISKIILKEFPVTTVKVTLSKPGALRGSDSVGISITRP
jgi:dihydroneopterin aldolase|tara:strand:+ start:1593 stop:1940 length:348 start_codon:yes stop_codon:yes gene_type:complete